MSDLISCQNASFGYDGRLVVQNLTLTIRRGDYLCIAGLNGSGKSTLIKGLLQLIKPVQGSVSYSAGLDRGSIGYLSQAAAAKKDFPAGVWEIVLSGNLGNMGLRPFYSRLEKQRALENLARLSIADLKECCYRELSGGQQRRVLIARALSAAQKLLILDEPAAGLDPLVTESLYQLLQKINQEMGITIVMVSHDMAAVEKYAGNIIRLER